LSCGRFCRLRRVHFAPLTFDFGRWSTKAKYFGSRLQQIAATSGHWPSPAETSASSSSLCILATLPRSYPPPPLYARPQPRRNRDGKGIDGTASSRSLCSPLAEDQIDHPAATNMRAWVAAVVEDFPARTPSLLQGVGQDRELVEGPVVVDGLGEVEDGGR